MENSPKNSIITQENEPRIYNGAFIVARQILNNELWLYKPASWSKIWVYILARVNFADSGKFKRGEGYFNFRQEAKNIGLDVTTNKIKKFMRYARRVSMVSTRRSTRGMIVKVLNYDKYQTLGNYTGTTQGTKEAPEKNQERTPICKNGMNEKKEKNVNLNTPPPAASPIQPPISSPVIPSTPTELMKLLDTGGSKEVQLRDAATPASVQSEISTGKQVNLLIEEFKKISPFLKYENNTERKALEEMLKMFGYEELFKNIQLVISIKDQKYAPVITTPHNLAAKWGQLEAYKARDKFLQPMDRLSHFLPWLVNMTKQNI